MFRKRKIEKKEERIKRKENLKKFEDIFVYIIIVVIVVGYVCYKNFYKPTQSYIANTGYVETNTETMGFIFKNETVIPIKSEQSIIPVVAQYERVGKDDTIAVYQNDKYNQYKEQIDSMDKKIEEAIKELPTFYSNEISAINTQIDSIVRQSEDTKSYIKMQEYKNTLDELTYKKSIAIGQLSPSGSTVKELIEKRNEYEAESKQNSDNIISSVSGVVTYKIDELEGKVNMGDILQYDVQQLDTAINNYKQESVSNFGVKVIDNYSAYLVIKQNDNTNVEYMNENVDYKITLLDKDNVVIYGKLVKKIESSGTYYCIFEVKNNIEELVDLRTANIKITWNKVSGIMVPTKTLEKKNDINYITLIKGSSYVQVPVKVKSYGESMCIVDNYSSDEKSKLGINTDYTIDLYDRVVI